MHVLLGVLGVAVLATSAAARPPRHARPPVQVQVQLSDRVKPYLPAPLDPRARSLPAEPAFPHDQPVAPIRVEHEQLLLALIADTADSQVDEKADLYFRLGEVYAQMQRYWRLQASAADARQDKPQATTAAHKAKDALLKAVKTFKSLTDNERFRSYPKQDAALFMYGYTLQSGKYLKEARAVYAKLLTNHPTSKYVPQVHFAFAEYHDEAGQLTDAEAHYAQVLKFPQAGAYWYAKYRLGAIRLQLQRYQEALEAFFEVVQATKADAKQDRLNRAARRDFVRAFAEVGKADKAHVVLGRLDAALALELFAELGAIYVERGKLVEAVYVHRELIKLAPADRRVCAWQYVAARALLSSPATPADKVREIENLVKLHGALAAQRTLPAADAGECRANAVAMAGELGRAFHAEAIATKVPETLAHAVRLYQAFLDGIATDPARPAIQQLHAEALWASAIGERNDRLQVERWDRAADAFAELARATRSSNAAVASVLAAMNALDVDATPPAIAPDVELARRTRPVPRQLPAREARLVELVASLAAIDPAHAELGALRFVEANLYRRHHQLDRAVPIYVALTASHRDAAFAEAAAMLAIESLIALQRLDDMLRLADRFAADPDFLADRPELARLVKLVRSRSMRR